MEFQILGKFTVIYLFLNNFRNKGISFSLPEFHQQINIGAFWVLCNYALSDFFRNTINYIAHIIQAAGF